MLISAIFLGLSWVTAEHFLPWVSWHNEILAFAAVMTASCGLFFFRSDKPTSLRFPSVGWPILLLAIVLIAQSLSGRIGFTGSAWVLLFYLALCFFSILVGFNIGLSNRPEERTATVNVLIARFSMLVILGAVCSVAVALAQVLEVWESASWLHRMPELRRPGANLGQTNQLATLILFSVASLVYLFESRRLGAASALTMAAFLLLGVAITESRTGALSLLLMAIWCVAVRKRLGFAVTPRVIGGGVVFFACCLWFWPIFLEYVLVSSANSGGPSQVNLRAGTRLLVWPQLWEAVLQRPWFGWGLGEVPAAHNAVLHLYAEGEPFTYAHNVILDLALGMGLPLTLLLVAMTLVWLWRRLRDTKDLLSWYCLALILPFGVHSMLEFPFAYAYLLAPVMLMFGVLEARLAPARAIGFQRWPVIAAWGITSAAMAWSVVEYIEIEEDFRVARFEAFNIGTTPEGYERPRVVLLTQLDALLEGARIVPEPGMSPQRIELARKVALRFPSIPSQNRYALSLALNGDPEEAVRQLRVMRAMHPKKYKGIKKSWVNLGQDKYPELLELPLP